MGTDLQNETRRFTHVYVIYDADVVGSEAEINCMSPASHLPAGYNGWRKRVGEIVAGRFTQTEDDSQYDYGYLAQETRNDKYLPAEDIPDDYEGDGYQGRHRKWVGLLTRGEWLIFADRYLIELDDRGFPVDYTDTLGAITEYGHLDAVSVDNSEGWQSGYGPWWVSSGFYVSFGGGE
jgi:hypothetical protein